jgi:hypothetical protein
LLVVVEEVTVSILVEEVEQEDIEQLFQVQVVMLVLFQLHTTYPITVGAGGAVEQVTNGASSGSNSIFSTITSTGGGGGGNYYPHAPILVIQVVQEEVQDLHLVVLEYFTTVQEIHHQ